MATVRGPYDLAEDQELLQRTVREFAAREIVPTAHDYDEREEFPTANVAKLAALDLLGMTVPEEYGGPGASMLDYVLALEQIAWACAAHAVIVSVNTSLV